MTNTSYKYRFSIFTATYNRGGFLKDLFSYIVAQDYNGKFEWVIVSDGSTDDTDDIVEQMIHEGVLNINYIKIPHGGKHKAWKAATNVFQGRYVVTADDDDPIPSTMLSTYDRYWTELEQSDCYDTFWEVKSRAQYEDGSLVGPALPLPYFDSDYIELQYILGKGAEMDGCRKVEVLRTEAAVPSEFWYEDKCSNFPEGVRWTKAARKYKTRFVPEVTRTYIIGHESLCTSTSKTRSPQRNYNSLVASLYTLNECGDLLIKYQFRKYLLTVLQLAYSSIRVSEHSLSKILHIRDRVAYLLLYFPAFFMFSIRGR